EDESWLQDTQEDQVWEFTAWQERTGGQRPERARGGYAAPANAPSPWDQRHAPQHPYGAWGRAPDPSPRQYADDGASRPYRAAGAYDAFGAPPAERASGDWTYSRGDAPAPDSYRYGAWDERSGGYATYGDDADSGPWDEETAELPAPAGSGRRFVNMRARASAMPELAAQWGRARPETDHPARGPRPSWLHRLLGRHSRSEVKLPPTWVTLNLLILLVVGVIAAPHVFAAEHHSCGWYTVEPGDTVPSLAQRYHATANNIGDANHLTAGQQLTEGQRLCIPSQAKADSVIAPVVRPPSAALPQPTPKPTPKPTPTPTPTPTPAKAAPTPKPGAVSGVQPFIKLVLPYAKRAHAQTGWPTSVIIAQWGVEHGWKLPSFTGYNFGNVASVPGEPTVPGTAAKGSPSRFSYAKTPEDGLRQYVKVAHLSYYAPVTAAAKVGANSCAIALGKSPWDAGHYGGASSPGSTLLGVMKSFNLYAYDK
ncbi:MAG TPA: LysM peptidoglycan-binding domain-containing protein, partial [Ktedonobacterales bacterium]